MILFVGITVQTVLSNGLFKALKSKPSASADSFFILINVSKLTFIYVTLMPNHHHVHIRAVLVVVDVSKRSSVPVLIAYAHTIRK